MFLHIARNPIIALELVFIIPINEKIDSLWKLILKNITLTDPFDENTAFNSSLAINLIRPWVGGGGGLTADNQKPLTL